MSADLTTPVSSATSAIDLGRHRRRGVVLLGVAVFNVWLWTTRLINLIEDPTPRTTGFLVVHAVLYVTAFGAALITATIGWRMRQEARALQSVADTER